MNASVSLCTLYVQSYNSVHGGHEYEGRASLFRIDGNIEKLSAGDKINRHHAYEWFIGESLENMSHFVRWTAFFKSEPSKELLVFLFTPIPSGWLMRGTWLGCDLGKRPVYNFLPSHHVFGRNILWFQRFFDGNTCRRLDKTIHHSGTNPYHHIDFWSKLIRIP